jgi:ankyrin repeat protein
MLYNAIMNKDHQMIDTFLSQGVKPDGIAENGDTPIHATIRVNDPEIFCKVVGHLHTTMRNWNHIMVNPLHEAIQLGLNMEDLVELNRNRAIIHYITVAENNPLMRSACLGLAVRHNRLDVASYCLKHGTNPNITVNDEKQTLMFYAIHKKYYLLVKMLANYGAHMNAPDIDGNTAIFHAVKAGDLIGTELLLTNGADPLVRNKDGITPTLIACKFNHEMYKLLTDERYRYNKFLA